MSQKKKFKLILNKVKFSKLQNQTDIDLHNYFEYNGHSYELLEKKFFEFNKLAENKKFYDLIHNKVYLNSISEKSFMSYFFQLETILKLPKSEVKNILEIGGGFGVFKNLINMYDYNYTSLDINNEYNPDIIGDVRSLKIDENLYDLICAFQVIEHIETEYTEQIFKELSRITKKYIFISLPIQINFLNFNVELSLKDRIFNRFSFSLKFRKLFEGLFVEDRDENKDKLRKDKSNPHYFEVGTKNFKKKKFLDLISSNNLKIISQFHNKFYPYHWFILMEKNR